MYVYFLGARNDVNEDLYMEAVQNPYYGCDVNIDINSQDIRTETSNRDDMEVITSIGNDYYVM